MNILLEELYKADIHIEKYHDRKIYLDENNYQINGITQSGKTKLVKNYLSSLKKNNYLYIDCQDIRIDIENLNNSLEEFCLNNNIDTVVLDNYIEKIELIKIKQLIITSEINYNLNNLINIKLYPLDYEEFLAYEHKYDSNALNHFIKLGALPAMHKIYPSDRNLYIQRAFKYSLDSIEFDILSLCAKMMSQKISAFTLYERLKGMRKISKDKLYKSFDSLLEKSYIHQIEKLNHKKAIKKVYLCDISLKQAFTTDKHFGRLFENMIFLELLKSKQECYYEDGIDFYLPNYEEIILCMPFTNEHSLFKKIEEIEVFIFSYQIKKVTVVTMNHEGKISHPISKIEMVPFDVWAILLHI